MPSGPISQSAHVRYLVEVPTVFEKPTFSNVIISSTSQNSFTTSPSGSLPIDFFCVMLGKKIYS